MRRLTILSALAAGMLALAPFSAALAAQSPQYMSSEPTNGAELHEAPEVVKVAFTEPLDASSELRVFACGTRVDSGETTVSLNQMEVELSSGPTGIYRARWVATGLGGITGSSAGFIEFSVGHGDKISCGNSGHGSGHGSGPGSGEGSGHEGGGHEGSGSGEGGTHSGGSHSSGGSNHTSTTGHSSGSGSGHSGSGGSGSGHSGSGGSGSGHSGSNHGGAGESEQSVAHGSSHGGESAGTDGPSNPDLAAGDGPLSIPTPEAGAIFLALAACIGLGITGGWLARLV